jgi:hypothetical protein
MIGRIVESRFLSQFKKSEPAPLKDENVKSQTKISAKSRALSASTAPSALAKKSLHVETKPINITATPTQKHVVQSNVGSGDLTDEAIYWQWALIDQQSKFALQQFTIKEEVNLVFL